MLTPAKYWRIPCSLDFALDEPTNELILPPVLANQVSPPSRGHGITIAAYDDIGRTGLLRWLGIVSGGSGAVRTIDWRPTSAQIWVDTGTGHSFWKAGSFAFAQKKIRDYGLHELWQQHFEGLELRDHAEMRARPKGTTARSSRIAPERLNPIEVIGQPTSGAQAGVVYLLKSAYGYKIGRTRSVPDRMRTFGVQLPFIYTIPLCVWFDDCHAAERRYHDAFASKRINGEWFDLEEADIEQIRMAA